MDEQIYVFRPQSDITVQELAQILMVIFVGIDAPNTALESYPALARHFSLESKAGMRVDTDGPP